MAETVFPARLPFWTVLWGWSLVLTNMISLPLMNAAGMFLEESEEKDYLGLASFIALSYIVVPFQAYAAFKGFLEKEEGPWFRTPKTGKITDILKRGTFYRFISGILPGRPVAKVMEERLAYQPAFMNKYMALATANNKFDGFRIRPKRVRWVSKVALALLLALTVTVYSATRGVPEVLATNWTNLYFRGDVESCAGIDALTTGTGASNLSQIIEEFVNPGPYYFYSDSLPTGATSAEITVGEWSFHVDGTFFTGGGGSNIKYVATLDLVDAADCSSNVVTLGSAISGVINGQADFPMTTAVTVLARTVTSGTPKRIRAGLAWSSASKGAYIDFDYNNVDTFDTNVAPATLTVVENSIYLLVAAPLIPMVVMWMQKRKKGLVYA